MFFLNDTATAEIYPLSLPGALPISAGPGSPLVELLAEAQPALVVAGPRLGPPALGDVAGHADRKSTRLNSSHANISYAVFCLKKKKILYKSRSTGIYTLP